MIVLSVILATVQLHVVKVVSVIVLSVILATVQLHVVKAVSVIVHNVHLVAKIVHVANSILTALVVKVVKSVHVVNLTTKISK